MKYYIIAGEASGDLHASNLMKALIQEDPQADFRYWGGDLMQAVGGTLIKHYRDLAFMGFLEVAKNIRTILGNFKICKADVLHWKPDVLILVDYPGFNLRIAKWAKEQGIKVFYYISPQIWAWHSSRVHQINKRVDRMFVILPFEKAFYQKYNYTVDFVGHPLLDVVDQYPSKPLGLHGDQPIIALLPGSRRQEINRMLDIMLELVPLFSDYQFVIAGAPSIPNSFYQPFLAKYPNIKLIENQTYALLQQATAALVTSGTATLETALFKVPQIVCYQGNTLNYYIARRLINVKYISLVNLILDRPLVKELIQDDFNPIQLKQELEALLQPTISKKILTGYEELVELLGNRGASARTARLMVDGLS